MAPTSDESYYATGGEAADTSGLDPLTAAGQQAVANTTNKIKEAALQKMINSGLFSNPNSPTTAPAQPSVPVQSPDYVPTQGMSQSDLDSRTGALADNAATMKNVSAKLKANAANETSRDNQMNALEDENPEDEQGYTTYKRMPKTRKMMGNDED